MNDDFFGFRISQVILLASACACCFPHNAAVTFATCLWGRYHVFVVSHEGSHIYTIDVSILLCVGILKC
jgi:hypothetical protein